jgi:hypothetical protein
VVGVGDGEGGAVVGLGVAGVSVGSGIREGVGAGRLAVGVPETAGLGLAAGALHPATRTRIRSATTG